MRNLKKFLALVLAMVMAFSLMLTASATDISKFEDQDKVTGEFVESVAVLTGLNVIKGDGDEDNPSIRPQSEITRAEAAALVYRIATGDINDTQVGLYADYSDFTDVKPRTDADAGDWFAGYVGYCQNAGIIKGKSATHFDPYGKVTGYEILAMILRAVGYGKNGEFEGSNWQVNVASLGKTKHITDSVTSVLYEGELQNYTLNKNARREIVAELLFRGSRLPQVTWTQIGGYNEYDSLLGSGVGTRNASLSEEVFGLYPAGWDNDAWGRPQFVWKATLNPTSNPARTVATLKAQPKVSFHDEKRECDVAELLEFGSAASKDYILYVNNGDYVTTTYKIVATDTVTKVGGYGRQTEIYTQEDMNEQFPWHNTSNYWSTDEGLRAPADTIVMVDTVAAKVLSKTDAVLDPAGHVITPARMVVDLYDGTGAAGVNNPSRHTISKPSTSKDNWEYSAGDVLSLNGWTDTDGSLNERHAFTEIPLPTGTLTEGTRGEGYVTNIEKMTGVSGKQTLVYWNQNKHQVDNEDKTDDLTLKLDKAGTNTNTTYTWYYDQFGYVQAIDEGSSVNYGVITSIYASFGQGETQTDGTAKAMATVKMADGTTQTIAIDKFVMAAHSAAAQINDPDNAASYARAVNTKTFEKSAQANATPGSDTNSNGVFDTGETRYEPAHNNTVEMKIIYDTSLPMTVAEPTGANIFAPVYANDDGFLHLAPAANSNMVSHNAGDDNYGILYGQMFKFVTAANDQVVAVEVIGVRAYDTFAPGTNYTPGNGQAGSKDGVFAGSMNDVASANGATLYKNLAYLNLNNSSTTVAAWIDNETKIMVRNPRTNAIACYDGSDALPGDVKIVEYSEIDWADTDNDGRAEFIYMTGAIDSQLTYGLFYFNGGASQWNGTTGTMTGWLNGEQTTLTFTSWAEYDKIKSSDDSGNYRGHLYAVEQSDGVVTDVLERFNTADTDGTVKTVELLKTYNAGWADELTKSGSKIAAGSYLKNFGVAGPNATQSNDAATMGDGLGYYDNSLTNKWVTSFIYGATNSKWGNSYDANTAAVYYQDSTVVSANTFNLSFTPDVLGGTVTVAQNSGTVETYRINPTTKVLGMGNGVLLGEGTVAAEYLNKAGTNEVTIVFQDDSAKSVLQMYVSTDPNITPSTDPNSPASFGCTPVAGKTNVWEPILPTTGIWAGATTTAGNSARDSFLKSLPAGVYTSSTNDMSYAQDCGAGGVYIRFNLTSPAVVGSSVYIQVTNTATGVDVVSGSMSTATQSGLASTEHYFYFAPPASGTYTYKIVSTLTDNPVTATTATGSFTW